MGEKEKKIIIGTHGKFGEELIKSAEMIIGNLENIKVFSLSSDMLPEEYYNNVENALKELPERTLCLTDLFGGTPCNTFIMLSKKYNNEIITGLNLPMLIEVCENINTLEIDELLSKIEYSSKDSIKNIKKLFNNKN